MFKFMKRLKLRIALWLNRKQPFRCGEIREDFKRKYGVEP